MTRTVQQYIQDEFAAGSRPHPTQVRSIEVDNMTVQDETRSMYGDFEDEIARRLRAVVNEYGEVSLKNAVIVGPPINADYDFFDTACGLTFISCPTMGDYRLGGVTYKTARAFEDA